MLENKDIFELVMDSGLDSTGIGIQCGDEDFARKYYNRKITNNIYLEYAKILFENNVYVGPNFIGGNCYEDEDIFMQTLALIKKIPFSITDPSKNFIANVQLKIHPHTPIASIAPKVVTDPMPAREWFYRAMLMESRRILDDEEFAECRTNKAFRDDPSAFRTFYHAELLKKQRVYFATLLDELKNGGKVSNVVFYGAGDLYKYNQTTFSPLSPAALLVDREYLAAMPSELNGLPVVAMEDFMRDKPDVTVIIFSRLATRMQRKLVRKWGMRNENIHTCTSILDLPQ